MRGLGAPALIRVTPFPNALLDTVMPLLGDTEWRILCVIVRQTLGWQGETASVRKVQDWLSHSQLKARTGRRSEAISKAVDGLVRRGLIRVHDSSQRLLQTPHERRRCHGRMYFSLRSSLLALLTDSESYDTFPFMSLAGTNSLRFGTLSFSQSEIRKAKTTK